MNYLIPNLTLYAVRVYGHEITEYPSLVPARRCIARSADDLARLGREWVGLLGSASA